MGRGDLAFGTARRMMAPVVLVLRRCDTTSALREKNQSPCAAMPLDASDTVAKCATVGTRH
jgi:hypothetical protein